MYFITFNCNNLNWYVFLLLLTFIRSAMIFLFSSLNIVFFFSRFSWLVLVDSYQFYYSFQRVNFSLCESSISLFSFLNFCFYDFSPLFCFLWLQFALQFLICWDDCLAHRLSLFLWQCTYFKVEISCKTYPISIFIYVFLLFQFKMFSNF